MPGIGDLFEEVTGIEIPDLEAWLSNGMETDAQLESMNLQILVSICICPGQRMTEPSTFKLAIEGNLGWYTGNDSQQEALQRALDTFQDELQTELTEELNGLSRNALNNLSTDQFESMVAEKVSAWADTHPFAWNNCR